MPEVVATVDEQPIYAHQVLRELERYQARETEPAKRVALATAMLDKLVLEKVLLTEVKRRDIKVATEEVAEALEQATRGYRTRDLNQIMNLNYMTPGLFRDRVEDQLRIERLLMTAVSDGPPPEDDVLQAYYQTHSDRFQKPEQVRARQILVRTREEAQQLREHARTTESFEKLAREHSLAPEASKGGELGFFGRGVMPPVFDEVCFTLEPRAISEVVASDYGFHLFQVIDKRPAEIIPFDEAKSDIARELNALNRREAIAQFVAELKNHAKIVRNLEVLARLVGTEEGPSK
jgi:parvulin-like peptidyl-prolyl isomerase